MSAVLTNTLSRYQLQLRYQLPKIFNEINESDASPAWTACPVSHGLDTVESGRLGRSAFISRREGRYLFRARWPACLAKNSTSAFRISLRTADYKVAAARAARIGSWMLNVKAAEDPEAALKALWPRLQALAVEPARDEADYVERSAFQLMAFEAQYRVRTLGLKPNAVVPGWDEHFVALVRENSRTANARAAGATVQARLERRRQELFVEGGGLAEAPRGPPPPAFGSPVYPPPSRKWRQAQPVIRNPRALPEMARRRGWRPKRYQ
jgi:hypothetical protein